jgi:hypothetical protein
MIAKAFLPFALGSFLASVLLSPALADPATTADLSGRKICWDNGNISSFSADGKYSSQILGQGTWVATAKGVEIHTPDEGVILDVDKQSDGTFKSKMERAAGRYWD